MYSLKIWELRLKITFNGNSPQSLFVNLGNTEYESKDIADKRSVT